MGIEFARIEARVCRIEACSVKRCYRMDARLFEFLLSRSIVYANIEAVRDGNDHFGLHFFFSSTDFAPDRFAAVSLFVFSKRQSARFVQMAAIKKRIFFSLSLSLSF